MSAPDLTAHVVTCLGCHKWQLDAPPRARRDFGVRGLVWEAAEALNAHWNEDHPGALPTLNGRTADLKMGDGTPVTGGMVGEPLPRWWDWISAKGTR